MHLKLEEGFRKTKGDIYRIIPPKMSDMDCYDGKSKERTVTDCELEMGRHNLDVSKRGA